MAQSQSNQAPEGQRHNSNSSPAATPQESEPKPGTPVPASSPQAKTEQEKEIEKQEQSQRMLGVVPQFAVTSRQNASPLTAREKFRLMTKSAFDPAEFGIMGLQAGISQAQNEFPGYGQGAAGYGKRYGAALADEVSAGFWSNFFWPVILKSDPRYFRLGQGTLRHRFAYSLAQEFMAHRDRGGKAFNFSNVLGAVSSGGLSNLYYPQGDRGFGLTMTRSAIALSYGLAGGLFNEFGPDIHRKVFHKRRKDSQVP